jgi:UDP-N-acetylmuramate dehydrogenase
MIDRFLLNKSLRDHCTFGIGGPSRYFIEIHTIQELQNCLKACYETQIPYLILGKGSNTLFHDLGFNGLIILNKIHFCEQTSPGIFYVGAGYSFSLLGVQTAKKKWSGLEFASGIPGSVGGAVFMNAGANRSETVEVLQSVEYIDEKGVLHLLPKEALHFAYRTSSFQQMRGAIASATFKLSPLINARHQQMEMISYRMKTQPYHEKSAGCIFRNPTESSAGALIDKCGLKGTSVGGARISDMHANFIVNDGTALASDVLSLIELVQKHVKEKMGIELESEVRVIPYNPNC